MSTHAKKSDSFSIQSFLGRPLRSLHSRKVRVALVTAVAAIAADYGLDVSEELLLAIMGVGASLILGIAHEDAGRNAASLLQRAAPPPKNSDGEA